jgi:hypothetical protein
MGVDCFALNWLLWRAVDKKADPSQKDILAVQQQVLAALEALFDQHKHLMPGWQDKTLLVV